MKEIFSTQNKLIKDLKKQKRTNRFLLFLDNPKSINDAFLAGFTPKLLLVDQEKLGKLSLPVAQDTIITNEEIIAQFSSTKTPQGVVAVYDFVITNPKKPTSNFLVLDGLQDAGNIGTLLRSALGADFIDVFLVDCTALTNDKVVRSSMSAIFRLNIYELARQEFVEFAKKQNLNLVCGDMGGENVFEIKSTLKNVGLVVGNEGNGVSGELASLCNMALSIPMANGLESLNVGVAGSIMMFQINQKKEVKL